MKLTKGIHHITAGTADGKENFRFYTEVLGLRLVKKTINFDDPSSYHLYYGDAIGTPGSIITFFVWPDAARGTRGAGEATNVTLAIPPGSFASWRKRLKMAESSIEEYEGECRLAVNDPDGMRLVLKETPAEFGWTPHLHGTLQMGSAIRGIVDVKLSTPRIGASHKFFTETLGLSGKDYRMPLSFLGSPTTITLDQSDSHMHHLGAGSIHHIAFRVGNPDEQREWAQKIAEEGRRSSPIMERVYFQSLYFREPSGVLIELATDSPGFSVDETVEQLGTGLCLPPWMAEQRAEIERVLPVL
jgi:glyoxalase family protein